MKRPDWLFFFDKHGLELASSAWGSEQQEHVLAYLWRTGRKPAYVVRVYERDE